MNDSITKREAWAVRALCDNISRPSDHWAREQWPASDGWYLYADLAEKLGIHEGNISKLVKPLEKKGVLQRVPALRYDERQRERSKICVRLQRNSTAWKLVIDGVKKMIHSGRYTPPQGLEKFNKDVQIEDFLKSDYVKEMSPVVEKEIAREFPDAPLPAVFQFWAGSS